MINTLFRFSFSDAVSSPHPQVPNARFTFSETGRSGAGSVAETHQMLPAGIDDTRMDLSQLAESGVASGSGATGRSVPNTPLQTSPSEHERAVIHGEVIVPSNSSNEAEQAGEQLAPSGSDISIAEIGQQEATEGPSGVSSEGESQVPEVTVSAAEDDDDDYDITESTTVERTDLDQAASTSEATAAQSGEPMDDDDMEDIEGEDRNRGAETGGDDESGDGVTSEGEKPGTSSTSTPMEEGSEAEVLPTPSTRARGRGNRGRRFGVRGSIPRYTGLNEALNRAGPGGSSMHQQRSPMGSPNRSFQQHVSPHRHHGQHLNYAQQQISPPMRRNTRSNRANRRSSPHYRP